MNIIYDNIIFSLQKAGGISVYWSELIKRADEKNSTFYGKNSTNIFEDKTKQINKESFLPTKILRYLSFQKKLPKNSIFHSSYYRISKQKDIVNITTVYDFTYEYYITGLARLIHSWQKGNAIKKSDGIICISQNTKKDLQKFYPKIEESKIEVIYLSASEDFKPLQNKEELLQNDFKELRNKKYILYIGDKSSYKNFDMALLIIQNLKNYYLVIVGKDDLTLTQKSILKYSYFHYQDLSQTELNILYNNAFCLFYPSSYEGFGIPILEAMKSGCPVISTNLSSIPEISQNAAILVDEVKIQNFIKAVLSLENDSFKEELVQKGFLQAKKFSWDKCHSETLEFYKKILEKKQNENLNNIIL